MIGMLQIGEISPAPAIMHEQPCCRLWRNAVSLPLAKVDPDGLIEYSVVFNDRSLNHMSLRFQDIMQDISRRLRAVYQAEAAVLVPGGGSFAMEAVARQFAGGRNAMVIRNGWFSYRWTQIFEMGGIPSSTTVIKARPIEPGIDAAFAPPPLDDVLERIRAEQPAVVFMPHVETSAGILLPDRYIADIADAVHAAGGLLVLDCVASGALWIDMQTLGVDVLISAPQKGWSASPCAGLVMLSARACTELENTQSSSFACDLRKWRQIMAAYENGGHAYHGTLPTDALAVFRKALIETMDAGLEVVRARQIELGTGVRELLRRHGYKSVAAAGFEASSVVVCHTVDDALHTGRRFAEVGLQSAAGVPLMCDEPAGFKTFRLGLFGLEKLQHVDRSLGHLERALRAIEEGR